MEKKTVPKSFQASAGFAYQVHLHIARMWFHWNYRTSPAGESKPLAAMILHAGEPIRKAAR